MTSQRFRLYAAEADLIRAGWADWYPGLDWAQADVDAFIKGKFWRANCGVRYVTLEGPSRGTGAIKVDALHWRIGFRPRSLCSINVAHEKTHVFVGVSAGQTPEDHEEDHDSRFAGAELEIVKRFLGADLAAALRERFEARKVRITPWEPRGVV